MQFMGRRTLPGNALRAFMVLGGQLRGWVLQTLGIDRADKCNGTLSCRRRKINT
jgi:hypothetical protein